MLVPTRKVGETLVIGDDVTVTVMFVENGKVSIGVSAPLKVRVDRSEVHERRKQASTEREAGQEAAKSPKPAIRRSRLIDPT